jgi:uncharacterized protein (DUF927 family)
LVKDITKAECVEWRNRFALKYGPSAFNHTLGIFRAIFEIGIEAGARRNNPAKTKEMKRFGKLQNAFDCLRACLKNHAHRFKPVCGA